MKTVGEAVGGTVGDLFLFEKSVDYKYVSMKILRLGGAFLC